MSAPIAGVETNPAAYRPRREAHPRQIPGRRGRIGLTRWGPASEDPIVLLHGWMDSGAGFQLLADQLPDDWPLLAIDWPGYGQSDGYEGGYWFPDYLADLEWLLQRLVPSGPARVIAHSLGGTVASMLAGIRPRSMRWLVDIEGFGLTRIEPDAVPARIAEWLDGLRNLGPQKHYASVEEVARMLCSRNPHLPLSHALFLADVWTRDTREGVQLLADELHRLPGPMRYAREEVEACWARITIPVLLIEGTESGYMRRAGGTDAAQRWRELMPGLMLRSVADAGHMLHYEQPAQTAHHIIEFAQGK